MLASKPVGALSNLRSSCICKQAFLPVHKVQPRRCLKAHGLQPNKNEVPTSKTASPDLTLLMSGFCLSLLADSPALADVGSTSPFAGVQANSLYVTMALFLMSVPGIWSQIKRAPQSTKKRKVFEVDGPARPGAMPIDDRARQIFKYFKQYNYEVKQTGEVITFVGTYAAEKGQAAAVTFYTFCGLASVALVLSIVVPDVGNYWYGLTALSPLAAWYYFQRGERQEEMKVKMVTADDDSVTDITIEGDQEEIERFRKELNLMEKGKVYVKGLLEK